MESNKSGPTWVPVDIVAETDSGVYNMQSEICTTPQLDRLKGVRQENGGQVRREREGVAQRNHSNGNQQDFFPLFRSKLPKPSNIKRQIICCYALRLHCIFLCPFPGYSVVFFPVGLVDAGDLRN